MTTRCSGLCAVRGRCPQPGDIEACGGIRGVWGRLRWPGHEVKALLSASGRFCLTWKGQKSLTVLESQEDSTGQRKGGLLLCPPTSAHWPEEQLCPSWGAIGTDLPPRCLATRARTLCKKGRPEGEQRPKDQNKPPFPGWPLILISCRNARRAVTSIPS